MSFKVGVITKQDSSVVFNALRFGNGGSAHEYGVGLKLRWPDVLAFEVQNSIDPQNCTFPVPSDRYQVRGRDPYVMPEHQKRFVDTTPISK